MNLVKIAMKMKLVNKLGPVIIIFATTSKSTPRISLIFELIVEAETMEINTE